jgi:hypothetical protein
MIPRKITKSFIVISLGGVFVMKKSTFFTVLIPLILLSLSGIVMGIPTVQMAPGQLKDITEEFEVWQGYYVLFFTLLGVEGDDAPYVTAKLNSWHQSVFDREEMTAEVTLTLIDSAPLGAELSITLSYKYTFSSAMLKRTTLGSLG